MATDLVRNLQIELNSMRAERDALSRKIAATEAFLAQMGAPVKRGPGRPPGSGVKRGPGRPKGSGVKRGPGRPPKSALVAIASGSGEAPVKRGPGRPKGSKNKRGPGRPKGSGTKASSSRRQPKWSQAARDAARKRMLEYWAKRRRKASAS
jgi:hypothetical protein